MVHHFHRQLHDTRRKATARGRRNGVPGYPRVRGAAVRHAIEGNTPRRGVRPGSRSSRRRPLRPVGRSPAPPALRAVRGGAESLSRRGQEESSISLVGITPSPPGPALIAPAVRAMVRSMTKCGLPIGIRTFRALREEGCYYVDETARARRMVGGASTASCRARGASARACSWTRARSCSRATSRRSEASPSTTAGTGRYAVLSSGSTSAPAISTTRTPFAKTWRRRSTPSKKSPASSLATPAARPASAGRPGWGSAGRSAASPRSRWSAPEPGQRGPGS